MKKIILLLTVICLGFTACSNEEGNDPVDMGYPVIEETLPLESGVFTTQQIYDYNRYIDFAGQIVHYASYVGETEVEITIAADYSKVVICRNKAIDGSARFNVDSFNTSRASGETIVQDRMSPNRFYFGRTTTGRKVFVWSPDSGLRKTYYFLD